MNDELDETNPGKNGNKYTTSDGTDETKRPPRKRFLLPWWGKIVLHVICNVVIITCAIFLIVVGVSYGDSVCQRWFTSLLISLLMSVVLWQPVQVILLAIIRVRLRIGRRGRRGNNNEPCDFENEHDHEDKGKSLNKYYRVDRNTNVVNIFQIKTQRELYFNSYCYF